MPASPRLPLSLPSIPLIPATAGMSAPSLQLPTVTTPAITSPLGRGGGIRGTAPNPKPPPFKIANSIVPIPAKLVRKIQALEYVDMRELLPDNIALAERLAVLPTGCAPPKQPGGREIGGDRALLSWVSSFATYIAVVAEAHPGRVNDMLAYMRLIIREASKFGGTGWLTYDAVFRRNQEGTPAPWSYLDASLHQVYIASQREKTVVPCKHCHEIDHLPSECAIVSLLPKSAAPPLEPTPERPTSKGKRPAPYSRQRPICASWNTGNCKFPGRCSYAHVCLACYGAHPAVACKERPPAAYQQRQSTALVKRE